MSLLLATAILAAGGLGLYMFKTPDDEQKGGEEYNEDNLFGSGSFWGSSNKSDDEVVEEDFNDSSFHLCLGTYFDVVLHRVYYVVVL